MKCCELRGTDCQAEVKPGWNFCPSCGTLLGAVKFATSETRDFDPATSLEIPAIQLQHIGWAAVKVKAKVQPPGSDAFKIVREVDTLAKDGSINLRFDASAPPKATVQLSVLVTSFD